LREDFSIEKREKHPPTNPLNALISFANSLVYTTVLSEIYHTQLNPCVSFLHQPGERRYSLALDIAEIFKPLIGDPIIFNLIKIILNILFPPSSHHLLQLLQRPSCLTALRILRYHF